MKYKKRLPDSEYIHSDVYKRQGLLHVKIDVTYISFFTYGIETDLCEGAYFMAGNEKVILDAGHGGCNLRDLKNRK